MKINVDKVVELYKKGLSLRQIAREFGVSFQYISLILKQAKVETRKYVYNLPESILSKYEREVLRLYRDNVSYAEIARRFNCHWTTIRNFVKKYLILRIKRGWRVGISDILEMKRLYKNKMPVKDIALKYNIPVPTTYYYLRMKI